jgi:hypothetical protein
MRRGRKAPLDGRSNPSDQGPRRLHLWICDQLGLSPSWLRRRMMFFSSDQTALMADLLLA